MMLYFFLGSIVVSIFLTLVIKKVALMTDVIDVPRGERKLHVRPVPLLGGVAIFLSFWGVVGFACLRGVFVREINVYTLIGIFIASLLIVGIGVVDDMRSVSVWPRVIITALAVLVAIIGGVSLEIITNPWGGSFPLGSWGVRLPFIELFVSVGDIVVFFWLLGMMYTTKILDGLDGLATGIAAIGGLIIFFLTQTHRFYQPEVGLLALIFTGVCVGFLIFNFHPAKIFLGEVGSLLIGFLLGILAVISGGKIATALLVMAIPILDIIRVVYLRIIHHRRIFDGDREHLHFRLLDAGFKEPVAVLFLYAVAFIFGLTTLFLQSKTKLITLTSLVVAMILVGAWLRKKRT